MVVQVFLSNMLLFQSFWVQIIKTHQMRQEKKEFLKKSQGHPLKVCLEVYIFQLENDTWLVLKINTLKHKTDLSFIRNYIKWHPQLAHISPRQANIFTLKISNGVNFNMLYKKK